MEKKKIDVANSKTISARLPMAGYMEVLKKASNRGQTIAEYLVIKLFADEKPTLNDSEKKEYKIGYKETVPGGRLVFIPSDRDFLSFPATMSKVPEEKRDMFRASVRKQYKRLCEEFSNKI